MEFFFQACINVEQVKNRYRELAKVLHPDIGGCQEKMKALNSQYHEMLSKLHGAKTIKEGKEYTYYYNNEMETELTNLIYRLLGLKMDKVNITLVGLWVWVEGETKSHRASLKGMKCRWHSKRLAWYYHSNKLKTRYNPNLSLDGLKEVYGASNVTGEGIKHFD